MYLGETFVSFVSTAQQSSLLLYGLNNQCEPIPNENKLHANSQYVWIHSFPYKRWRIHHFDRLNTKTTSFNSQSINEKDSSTHTLIYDAGIMIDVYVYTEFIFFFTSLFGLFCCPFSLIFIVVHSFVCRQCKHKVSAHLVYKDEKRTLFDRLMISNVWERKSEKIWFFGKYYHQIRLLNKNSFVIGESRKKCAFWFHDDDVALEWGRSIMEQWEKRRIARLTTL